MAKYLLDTTGLINHMRGRQDVIDLVTQLALEGHQLGVCCINVAELYAGLDPQERSRGERLIASLDYYDTTRRVASLAGSYQYDFARRGTTLTAADTLIAATAVTESAVLVTANERDFPMEELSLRAYR